MTTRTTTRRDRQPRIPSDWWLVPVGIVLFGMTALGAVLSVLGQR